MWDKTKPIDIYILISLIVNYTNQSPILLVVKGLKQVEIQVERQRERDKEKEGEGVGFQNNNKKKHHQT